MGQRHQVYFFTNQGNFAWHNQWCYGRMPIRQLELILRYEENNDRPNKDGYGGYGSLTQDSVGALNVQRAIELIMNTDVDMGSIHNNYDITGEVCPQKGKDINGKPIYGKPNFFNGDNNDGITICDTRKYPFRYAFLFFPWGLEKPKNNEMRPLTAAEYFEQYRSDYDKNSIHHHLYDEALTSIDYVQKNSKLLTLNQIAKLFPESMKAVMEERRNIQKTKFEDLPTMINDEIKYPVNKELIAQRLNKAA